MCFTRNCLSTCTELPARGHVPLGTTSCRNFTMAEQASCRVMVERRTASVSPLWEGETKEEEEGSSELSLSVAMLLSLSFSIPVKTQPWLVLLLYIHTLCMQAKYHEIYQWSLQLGYFPSQITYEHRNIIVIHCAHYTPCHTSPPILVVFTN